VEAVRAGVPSENRPCWRLAAGGSRLTI
jgi:hypothetical protein